jgi:hypothetical protein
VHCRVDVLHDKGDPTDLAEGKTHRNFCQKTSCAN